MSDKYFVGESIIDWIRDPRKTVSNSSIVWKALDNAFPIIDSWIAWKIGNGKNIRVGLDPWVGSSENYRLPEATLASLHEAGVFPKQMLVLNEHKNGVDIVGN
jgi:hypothetical protein